MFPPYPELVRAVAVGRVGPHGVRLWLRSPGGGPHRLTLWSAAAPDAPRVLAFDMGDRAAQDHTFTLVVPEAFPGLPPLPPATRHGFRITRADGTPVGEGTFETTPATPAQMPRRFAIGLASCHQPFDDAGRLHARGLRMLRAARTAWERSDVKLVLWLGDQLYADYPATQSLFDPAYFRHVGPPGRARLLDCSREEALALYHARYRRNWGQPEWLALQARFPGYPILDDHEVVDNFGSLPEHHTEAWRHVRQAAGAAYQHYQHARVEPPPADGDGPYDYAFEYGAVAGYVLDVRSARRASADDDTARVFAPHQLEHLAAWLNANAAAPLLLVALSVPPFFMPTWLARLARHVPGASFREDALDRWMHPQYREDRERLLTLLEAHQHRQPRQKVALLCGDVHVGFASRCEWRTEPPTALYQFVSSSVTHRLKDLDWQLARLLPRTHFIMNDLGGRRARIHLMGGRSARLWQQPVGGLNVGVLEVELGDPDRPGMEPTGAPGSEARLNFKLYGESAERPDEPELLFESGFE